MSLCPGPVCDKFDPVQQKPEIVTSAYAFLFSFFKTICKGSSKRLNPALVS